MSARSVKEGDMEPKRQISFWIRDDEYRWLVKAARAEGCSRTEMLRKLIRERKEEDERKQQPPQF